MTGRPTVTASTAIASGWPLVFPRKSLDPISRVTRMHDVQYRGRLYDAAALSRLLVKYCVDAFGQRRRKRRVIPAEAGTMEGFGPRTLHPSAIIIDELGIVRILAQIGRGTVVLGEEAKGLRCRRFHDFDPGIARPPKSAPRHSCRGLRAHRPEGRFPAHPLKTCESPRCFLSYAAQAHRKLHP
jgi:hypothetical protein